VGVFVNRPREEVDSGAVRSGIHAIQLHGNESPEDCVGFGRPVIKSFRVSPEKPFPVLEQYRVSGVLLDSGFGGAWGGTGVPIDWNYVVEHLNAAAETVRSRLVLAGGLNPENVEQAIRLVQPSAVDVSSGVEDEPGKKNEHLIKEFIHAVRNAGLEQGLA
jgi:phosphoribosylanthranilate isomerase